MHSLETIIRRNQTAQAAHDKAVPEPAVAGTFTEELQDHVALYKDTPGLTDLERFALDMAQRLLVIQQRAQLASWGQFNMNQFTWDDTPHYTRRTSR